MTSGTLALLALVVVIVALCCTMIVAMRGIRRQHVRSDLSASSVTQADTSVSERVRDSAVETRSWANEQLEMVRKGP